MGTKNVRAPVCGARNDEIGKPSDSSGRLVAALATMRMSGVREARQRETETERAANLLSLQILEKFRGGFHPTHKKMVSRSRTRYIEQVPFARVNLFQIGIVT